MLVLAFYSDNPSSNPTEACSFFCKSFCLTRTKINKNRPWMADLKNVLKLAVSTKWKDQLPALSMIYKSSKNCLTAFSQVRHMWLWLLFPWWDQDRCWRIEWFSDFFVKKSFCVSHAISFEDAREEKNGIWRQSEGNGGGLLHSLHNTRRTISHSLMPEKTG